VQQPLLSTAGLTLGYRDVTVLANIAFELNCGDVLAVVGHNGSGKSTLIKTLLGNLPPLAGTLAWRGGKPDTIAYLGQRTEFDSHFPIRVRDLAAMGAWSNLGMFGRVDKRCLKRVDAALERTGIADIANTPLHQLSAGQLQRALFARTMVQDASLILLDEPFTAVDQTTEVELLTLIDDWAAQKRSVILILHDLSAVLKHCNIALLLGKGTSMFGEPCATLTPKNLIELGYLSPGQAQWFEAVYTSNGVGRV